jgi:hypothetical protein
MKNSVKHISKVILGVTLSLVSFGKLSAQENPDGSLQVLFAVKHVICQGDHTGSIQAWANGGQAPYTYLWSNGFNESYIAELPAGVYDLTVLDAAGASNSLSIEVSQNDSIQITYDVVHASGNETQDGAINVAVSGGAITESGLNFSFTWSNGAETLNQSNLNSGNYFLTVTDELGCAKSVKIKVLGSEADLQEEYILTPIEVQDTDITVYPNPSVGEVTIAYNPMVITTAQIFSLNGMQRYTVDVNSAGKTQFNNLPKGEYVVKFFEGNKLIKSERLSVLY